MFPTLNDREIHRTEVRQFTYNQITQACNIRVGTPSINDTSHVNPVTDILLDSASSFPKGCEVVLVSFDPINQESEIISETLDLENYSFDPEADLTSEASGSVDTVREKSKL